MLQRMPADHFRRTESSGLSREEAIDLIEHGDLASLLRAASEPRDRGKGRVVSYSKKVCIPLTDLCRDYCGYCTFRSDPVGGRAAYMTPDEVLAVAEAGARVGCKEALFSLGDQPERIFPEAREFLAKLGFARTLDYLAAMTRLAFEQTGLLPHSNPVLMDREDLTRLPETNVSLGLVLESSNPRLLAAGINDWGGISPVTRDLMNPEAAWPQIPILQQRTQAAGFVLRERLAIYPEFARRGDFIDERLMPPLDKQRSGDFYAREDA